MLTPIFVHRKITTGTVEKGPAFNTWGKGGRDIIKLTVMIRYDPGGDYTGRQVYEGIGISLA